MVVNEQFLDRAIRLVDRLVGERSSTGIGIGDCYSTAASPADQVRTLLWKHFRIGQSVISVSVSVRPAIYCDGDNILCWVKSAGLEYAIQLLPDLDLEILDDRPLRGDRRFDGLLRRIGLH